MNQGLNQSIDVNVFSQRGLGINKGSTGKEKIKAYLTRVFISVAFDKTAIIGFELVRFSSTCIHSLGTTDFLRIEFGVRKFSKIFSQQYALSFLVSLYNSGSRRFS